MADERFERKRSVLFRGRVWRHVVITMISIGLSLGTILIIVVTFLAMPGTPDDSSSMHFEGFVKLPQHGLLSILDYLSIAGDHLYVTNISHGTLVDAHLEDGGLAKQDRILEMDGAGAAHGVALVPSNGSGLITRSKINRVDVFDLKQLKPLNEIAVSDDPDAILYLPQSHLVYVAHGDAKLATLIDVDKRAVSGTIALGGKAEFAAFDTRTGLSYQNLEDVNSLVAVDINTRSVVGRWPLGPCQGPSGMAIDTAGRIVFSVCSKNAMLVVINLDTHKVIAAIKIGALPDSVAYDETLHRIYIAGGTGTLTVLKQDAADSYRVLDSISTHFGAHTLAIDPKTHRVYVAYGSLLVPPRIAVFSPIIGETMRATPAP